MGSMLALERLGGDAVAVESFAQTTRARKDLKEKEPVRGSDHLMRSHAPNSFSRMTATAAALAASSPLS